MIKNDDLLFEFLEEIDEYNKRACEVGQEDEAISMTIDDIGVISPFYNIDGRFKVNPIKYYGKYKLMGMVEDYREVLRNEIDVRSVVEDGIDNLMGTLVKKFMLESGDEHSTLSALIADLEEELVRFVENNL